MYIKYAYLSRSAKMIYFSRCNAGKYRYFNIILEYKVCIKYGKYRDYIGWKIMYILTYNLYINYIKYVYIMCIYIHIYVYVYIFIYMYICVFIYIYSYMFISSYIYTYYISYIFLYYTSLLIYFINLWI